MPDHQTRFPGNVDCPSRPLTQPRLSEMLEVREKDASAKGVRAEMPFPEVERVIYTTNLIDEVICQFRFPPVLRIDSGPPADFQDRIRDRFPLYRVKANVPFISGIPDNLAPMLKGVSFGQTTHVHEFISKDEKWILSLAAESISLRCRQYERWENFKDYFRVPILALEELYRPSFYSRVGLRYRDLICRSKVDLSGVKWDELLQPWITGV